MLPILSSRLPLASKAAHAVCVERKCTEHVSRTATKESNKSIMTAKINPHVQQWLMKGRANCCRCASVWVQNNVTCTETPHAKHLRLEDAWSHANLQARFHAKGNRSRMMPINIKFAELCARDAGDLQDACLSTSVGACCALGL